MHSMVGNIKYICGGISPTWQTVLVILGIIVAHYQCVTNKVGMFVCKVKVTNLVHFTYPISEYTKPCLSQNFLLDDVVRKTKWGCGGYWSCLADSSSLHWR